MKDATVLEKGGLNLEALDRYSLIYSTYQNADASVGMKRMAQQILNEKVQKAQLQCMSENFDAALSAFDDAIAFRNAYPSFELKATVDLDESQRECQTGGGATDRFSVDIDLDVGSGRGSVGDQTTTVCRGTPRRPGGGVRRG